MNQFMLMSITRTEFSDQNFLFSFHHFKIPLFSMPSSHYPVIAMFHCLFIVLKIPLFSMSSSHDLVIRIFHCLFTVLKISLFSLRSSDQNVPLSFHRFKISLFSMPSNHSLFRNIYNIYLWRYAKSLYKDVTWGGGGKEKGG
jgi:hypothetical protein